MALALVSDYIAQARIQLQDLVTPKRYSDATLMDGLNSGVLDMVRLRPDLTFKLMRTMDYPPYDSTSDPVDVDIRFRSALLHYVIGWAQLQDMEETSDPRAAAFMQAFTAKLMTLQA